jgi:Phosphotransferase system mannitol/fructose-specific IIA domain (Ntr-type)
MNCFVNILSPEHVQVGVSAGSKKRVFEHVGLLFEHFNGIARAEVSDNLFARERLGSTSLGHGVAIPHGRIKGVAKPLAAVLRLQQPIGFDAPDDLPVDLLFFLLVPEAATQEHLEILSQIAEMLSDQDFRDGLKKAETSQGLYEMIVGWQSAYPAQDQESKE